MRYFAVFVDERHFVRGFVNEIALICDLVNEKCNFRFCRGVALFHYFVDEMRDLRFVDEMHSFEILSTQRIIDENHKKDGVDILESTPPHIMKSPQKGKNNTVKR